MSATRVVCHGAINARGTGSGGSSQTGGQIAMLPTFVCCSSLLVTHEASQFPTPPQAAAQSRLAAFPRLPFLILLFAQSSMYGDNGTALRSVTGTKAVM